MPIGRRDPEDRSDEYRSGPWLDRLRVLIGRRRREDFTPCSPPPPPAAASPARAAGASGRCQLIFGASRRWNPGAIRRGAPHGLDARVAAWGRQGWASLGSVAARNGRSARPGRRTLPAAVPRCDDRRMRHGPGWPCAAHGAGAAFDRGNSGTDGRRQNGHASGGNRRPAGPADSWFHPRAANRNEGVDGAAAPRGTCGSSRCSKKCRGCSPDDAYLPRITVR